MNSASQNSPDMQVDILYCTALIASLRQQRDSEQLCDFVICVGHGDEDIEVFHSHKCVLASVSEEILNTPSTVNGMEIHTNKEVVQSFIDYAYSGKITELPQLSIERVGDIWKLGEFLKAKSFQAYLLKNRSEVLQRIESEDADVDIKGYYVTNPPCDASNSTPSENGSAIDQSILSATNSNDDVTECKSDISCNNLCIPEGCDKAVKVENNSKVYSIESEYGFPSNYIPSNNEISSPLKPTDDATKATKIFFPRPPICLQSSGENGTVLPEKAIKVVNGQKRPASSYDVNLKGTKQKKISIPTKSRKSNAVTSLPQMQNFIVSEALKSYNQSEIDLLKELKEIIPNASLWSVLPNLE